MTTDSSSGPSSEKHETLPTQINDQDRSSQGGPPGWIAFSIIAGMFVLGVFAMLLLFGVFS